jgi:Transposase and inactivated derivatives
MLDTHWSGEATAKTHNFWAFKQFTDRLATTAEEYGSSIAVRSEAWTSQECPQCGSTDRTHRHEDLLLCQCGFEGHADLTASATFLSRQTEQAQAEASGRWQDPCGWSGTVTNGWRYHALTKVPNNSAQTRVPSPATGILRPGNRPSRDSHGGNRARSRRGGCHWRPRC